MQITEVLVGSRRGESERIAVIGVERLRFLESVVGRADAVRNIVLVGPGYGSASLHGHCAWREEKVVNRHRVRRALGAGKQDTSCQHRADDRAEYGTSDNRTQHLCSP